MLERLSYLFAVVAIGWAVTFGLRSLPFLLFAGRDRDLPPWVERLGRFISPVIIGGLIVYSYSGLEWKTLWPYAAGFLTVGLQVWKRNPLVSIVAGTALYMALLSCCGCASATSVSELDASHPELRLSRDGIYVGDRRVRPEDVVDALEDAEIPKDRAIHIRMDCDMADMRGPRALMGVLAQGGYTRSVLVTEKHGESRNKSGNAYAGSERMTRRTDVDFYVTGKGVHFGLLTPVGPKNVLRCLAENGIGRDQLIRLNYRASESKSPPLVENLNRLEDILAKGGYTNVCRFDVEKRRRQQAPSSRDRSTHGASSSQGELYNGSRSRSIRYKKADE